jgi:thiol-disulfide isomerase/thioredoxin
MSSAPVAALVVALTLSAVLLVSGAAKLRDSRATQDAFVALRVPDLVPVGAGAAALPWVEVVLAVLLVASPTPVLVPVAVAVLLLMAAYTVLIARALRFDDPVTCSCFGSIGRHEVGTLTLGRNVLLTLLTGFVLWFAIDGGSAPSALGSLDADGWWALLAAMAAVAVAVLVVAPSSSGEPVGRDLDGELVDYERHPIPYGVLRRMDGATLTLTEAATTQARLVVVLNSNCGPCIRTAEKLDGWAQRLDPVVGVLVVYPDEAAAAGQVGHSPDLSTWEPDWNVRRVFALAPPSVVLLGADGFLAGGPVSGEDEVNELVETVLAEVEAAATTSEQ